MRPKICAFQYAFEEFLVIDLTYFSTTGILFWRQTCGGASCGL